MGIQSFLSDELVWMNRAHTATESLACIDKIIATGFTNFSIDLIYGSPLLSDEDWKRNVEIVIAKNQDDWFEKIEYYIKNSDKRNDIILAGQKRVLKDHTYHNRAQQFLDIYNK